MGAVRHIRLAAAAVCLAIGAALLFPSARASAQELQRIPVLVRSVTDFTSTLSFQERKDLEAKLERFRAQKGAQIAVLLVPTTRPEPIETYSMRVVEQWELGRKEIDDGVLLLVAKDDRRSRIEVGHGLEGAIPDVIASRILHDIMTPYFQRGEFAAGIDAAVEALMKRIQGEPLPLPSESRPAGSAPPYMFLVILGLVLGSILTSLFGRRTGAILSASASGLFGITLLPFAQALLLAAMVYFAVLAIGSGRRRSGYYYHPGGFGSFGGGFPTGRGSSSGGYSGGGGSFGGGGASGSW